MEITNALNLPEAIVEAIRNDPYLPGDSDITVTKLIAPPQQTALTRIHADEIVEDASDRIYALMGQAMHVVLERANITGIVEKRMYALVAGWRVSGAFDSICVCKVDGQNVLMDFKQMSIWEKIFGLRDERTHQLNLLDWIIGQNRDLGDDFKIDRIEVVGVYRDWSKREAARKKAAGDDKYPQNQVGIIPIEKWDEQKQFDFIYERVALHQAARKSIETKLELIPPCSDEDRWASDTTFALMKEGRKSALKVEDSMDKIALWAGDKGHATDIDLKPGFSIVERPGENIRCQDYCAVADFCPQWAALKNGQ